MVKAATCSVRLWISLTIFRDFHVQDGLDFLWVGLDTSLADHEIEELSRSYVEGAL